LPRTASTTDSQAQVKPPLFQIRDTRVVEAVTDITGIVVMVDVIDAARGHVLLLVLIVGPTGGTGIGLGIEIEIEIGTEMTTDTEILAGLLRRKATTILEDIDMTYHPNQTLFTDSLPLPDWTIL